MKKLLLLMGLAFALVLSVSLGWAADLKAVGDAQELKAAGDYKGAALIHPKKLCKAMYFWNAACKVVGHRNANRDWAINSTVSDADKETGLALLQLAQTELDTYSEQDGTENEGCKGVKPESLQKLIDAVKACIEGRCK